MNTDQNSATQERKSPDTLKEKQKEGRGPAGFLNKIKEFFEAEEE